MKHTFVGFLFVLFAFHSFSAEAKKVVLFYSSINRGHIQVAESVKESLLADDADQTTVVLKDIRDFESLANRSVSKKVYDFLINRYPKIFSRFYDSFLSRGQQVMSLGLLQDRLDTKALESYISAQAPDTILSTHYGASEALSNIRERGGLRNTRIGWLHTDFITGYFPRISKAIDKTFVHSDFVAQRWADSGVAAERVEVTGTPLSIAQDKDSSRAGFKSAGLDELLTTISVDLGDQAKSKELKLIIESIANRNRQSIQVFIKRSISDGDLADIQSSFPNCKVVTANGNTVIYDSIAKASDVMVVPSSYINETLGKFNLVPVVIYDSVPGVDHGNALVLAKSNLAMATDKTYRVGTYVKTLLENQEARKSMLEAQLSFRNGQSIQKIADFVKKPNLLIAPDFKLGVEAGTTVNFTKQALEKLDYDSPADIEILMAYGKYPNGDFFTDDGNPFGHLAIKIKDKVYTVNGLAKVGVESNGIHVTTLEDYLYSIQRTNVNEEHTDTFGAAFARHTISIRVSGVTVEKMNTLAKLIQEKQEAWRRGDWSWKAREYNCADFVEEMLFGAGFKTAEHKKDSHRVNKFTFPLDVFDRYLDYFENDPTYRSELVGFTYIPDSNNLYRRPTFPLSLYQPKRLIKHLVKRTLRVEEAGITKRIAFYPTDFASHYENLDGSSEYQRKIDTEADQAKLDEDFAQLNLKQANLDLKREAMLAAGFSTNDLYKKLETGTATPQEIAEWNQHQKEFQVELDSLIVMQLDHFAEKIVFYLKTVLLEAQHRVATKDYQELLKLYNEATEAHIGYLNMKSRYGLPKDIPRTAKYRLLYEVAEKFVSRADVIVSGIEDTSVKPNVGKIYLKLSKDALLMAGQALFGSAQSMKYVQTGNGMMQRFADLIGVSVNVRGQGYIDALPKLNSDKSKRKKIVNIIAPIHRHPVWDMVAYSQLGIHDALPFIFFPKPVARFINKHFSNIIAVGGGSDTPIDAAIAELEKGYTQNLLIYPEGSVSAGMMETRPGREKFTWGLIKRLRELGYEINLVPIVYQNTAKFGNENTITRAVEIAASAKVNEIFQVEVGKPLDTKMIDTMMAVDDQAINRYIRGFWLENMVTDEQLFSGQLRPATMNRLVNESFQTRALKAGYCARFYGGK